jgi:hypothetical protein
MSAETEKLFYTAFDPDVPSPGTFTQFYVDLDEARGGEITEPLIRELRRANPASPVCRLLAGHKGSGKTVELMHMARELEKDGQFTVFHWLAEATIDLAGVDFPDLALGLVSGLAQWLKDSYGIKLEPGYFATLGPRLKDYLKSEVTFDDLDLELGIAKITGHIKQSPNVRAQVRAALDPDSDSLLAALNAVIGEAKEKLKAKGKSPNLVILVDDLDKGGWDRHPAGNMTTGEFLFDKRHLQLRGLLCHVVYVLPLDLAYQRIAGTIQTRYGNPQFIPMVQIRTRPPENRDYPRGMEFMRTIIRKRLHFAGIHEDAEAFDPGVMDTLIRASGGEPRQLMHLIREALNYGALPLTARQAELAITSSRKTLRRPLGKEDWAIIQSVATDGLLPRDTASEERVRGLLLNRHLLQYANGDEWFAPSPLLGELPAA